MFLSEIRTKMLIHWFKTYDSNEVALDWLISHLEYLKATDELFK